MRVIENSVTPKMETELDSLMGLKKDEYGESIWTIYAKRYIILERFKPCWFQKSFKKALGCDDSF